jgi:sensor histidine kinase YesM
MIFIPCLGIGIPFVSGLINYQSISVFSLLIAHVYFIGMSWCIWASAAWLHHKIRYLFGIDQNVFFKIVSVSFTNALFGGAIASILTLIWFRVSGHGNGLPSFLICVFLSVLAVVIFTLVYEIMYLSKERQLESDMVHQLDREKTMAEISNLKSELEPHFLFNSLNTLSHLILFDPKTAHIFNSKLASILKYFLINKNKETISLKYELEFMDDYIYLLRLRYDNKIELLKSPDLSENAQFSIIPFALQITVENAIKHNEFTEECPLRICVELTDEHLLVKNKYSPKLSKKESTGTGLHNLSLRYQLICEKDIVIQNSFHDFIVKIPLIQIN